jgi:glycosyltransferase involved in cell wall biosynthesis
VRALNVLHVLARLEPGSGVTEMVLRLASGLRANGLSVTVAACDGPPADGVTACEAQGVRIARFRPGPPDRISFSTDMLRSLSGLARAADIVHVHGAWTFPVWWGCHVAAREGRPLVRTPHGSFLPDALRQSALRKRVVGCLVERRSLRTAALVHATAAHEVDALRRWCAGPIVVVPNAVDVPGRWGPDGELRARVEALAPACRGRRYVLMLSRLHPMKGLEHLLDAWGGVAPRFPEWHLVIAGGGDPGYAAGLARRVARAGLGAWLTFAGPLYGADREAVLSQADLVALPSRSENFGMSVAEALARGVPVVATHGTPWAGVAGAEAWRSQGGGTEPFEEGVAAARCGWWVAFDAAAIAAALEEALRLGGEARRAMGAEGRRWVSRCLDGGRLVERMQRAYGQCIGDAAPGREP